MIAAWKKKVASCDRRVKHFPFLQKQTLLGTKKLHVSRVHQKLCEKPFGWKMFLIILEDIWQSFGID